VTGGHDTRGRVDRALLRLSWRNGQTDRDTGQGMGLHGADVICAGMVQVAAGETHMMFGPGPG
jgi:hypothetical protein